MPLELARALQSLRRVAPRARANPCARAMSKEDTLVVHEIYASIQGESTFAGLPCTFVRTTGCNLRCTWCDTPQAFYGGTRMTLDDVLAKALAFDTKLIELTGGEPLIQPATMPLLRSLCDAGRTVLIETSGEAGHVSVVDPRVHKIMDLKAPLRLSGESHRNRWSNLDHISPRDEIKFVLAGREDYEWMRDTIRSPRSRLPHPEAPGQHHGVRAAGWPRAISWPGCLEDVLSPGPGPAPDAQVHLGARSHGRLSRCSILSRIGEAPGRGQSAGVPESWHFALSRVGAGRPAESGGSPFRAHKPLVMAPTAGGSPASFERVFPASSNRLTPQHDPVPKRRRTAVLRSSKASTVRGDRRAVKCEDVFPGGVNRHTETNHGGIPQSAPG